MDDAEARHAYEERAGMLEDSGHARDEASQLAADWFLGRFERWPWWDGAPAQEDELDALLEEL